MLKLPPCGSCHLPRLQHFSARACPLEVGFKPTALPPPLPRRPVASSLLDAALTERAEKGAHWLCSRATSPVSHPLY